MASSGLLRRVVVSKTIRRNIPVVAILHRTQELISEYAVILYTAHSTIVYGKSGLVDRILTIASVMHM
jgi:hypothetical protein